MKKGTVPIIISIVFLTLGLALTATIILATQPMSPSIGTVVGHVHSFVQGFFGFDASGNALGLIPAAGLLILLGILCLVCRKHPAYWWSPFLSIIICYTIYLFSLIAQGVTSGNFLLQMLVKHGTGRFGAPAILIAAICLETLLAILLILISNPLDARHKRKLLEQKAQNKRVPTKAKQQPEQEKPEEETMVTFSPDEPTGLTHPVKPVAEDVPLVFPTIEEGPKLKVLAKTKQPAAEPVAQASPAAPDYGEVFKHSAEERIDDPNVASAKLFTSGQLVAAVQKRSSQQAPPKPRGKGLPDMLAQAQAHAKEEQQPPKQEPEQQKHKLFGFMTSKKSEPASVEPVSEEPLFEEADIEEEEVPATPVEHLSPKIQELKQQLAEQQATVKPEPVVPQEKPAPVAVPASYPTHSTARPVNGGVDVDAPVAPPAQEPLNPEDDINVLSGVGGLSSSNEGKSALLNRKRMIYQYPPMELLQTYPDHSSDIDAETVHAGELLIDTLEQFKIQATLMNIIKGPTVTMFEISPAAGIKVARIVSLADNIALTLAARRVRIVAPIPGKQAVGIEVPNKVRQTIGFKEMLPAMDQKECNIPMVLGRTITGDPVVIDLASMPHLLIAGSTGSGKSVCVNSLICSILYRKSPKEVRLIMVDPKIVELKIYNGIPHLLTPVITDAKKTIKVLEFCIFEMERRYKLLQGLNVRSISAYNKRIVESRLAREKLPYIAVIIDEFADLMATVGKELEFHLARLAAMSRAVGIHLVLATQRPSVNVITGLIKSNIPSRIAFAVTSVTDSRIIIDEMGAEKLLGKGDMLYNGPTDPVPSRLQGAFLSDDEVEKIVQFACTQGVPDYIDEVFFEDDEPSGSSDDEDECGDCDADLFDQALKIVVERKGASASYLQRRLKIGYNRAARLVEQMEEMGYVGGPNGSKPRELLRYPD